MCILPQWEKQVKKKKYMTKNEPIEFNILVPEEQTIHLLKVVGHNGFVKILLVQINVISIHLICCILLNPFLLRSHLLTKSLPDCLPGSKKLKQ